MPLINIGYIDGLKLPHQISLLGTEGTPVVATRTVTGGTAVAGWRFLQDGTTDKRQGSWSVGFDDWYDGSNSTPGDSYEIRATRLSGSETTLATGNLGTWEVLDSTRTYELSNSNEDNSTMTIALKIEIRDVSENVVRDTGYYDISAKSNAASGTTTVTTVTTVTTETTVSQ